MSTETTTTATPTTPTTPTTPAHRIFVGNLTQTIEGAELEKSFAEFGKVLSVRIISKKFQSNTFGFVDMEDLEAANKAVAAINGKEFDGKAVTVELARERSTEKKPRQSNRKTRGPRRNNKSSGEKKEDDTSATTTTTDATTTDATTTTTSNRPARRRNIRRAKPSDKKEDAADTTTESTTTENAASPSTATTSSAKSKRPKRERKSANTADRQQSSTTLFVRNIPYSFDDAKLLEAFKEYSPKSAHVIVNKHTSKSKGFGFVEFEDAANQQKGLALNKHKVEDRELSVKVALIPEHTPDTATTTA